ncbi:MULTISPECIES: plasmid partitioning protein RepB [Agrobacterium tumefaciens complex]|uniref:plasmid partitioning protein RepB n=1 Tax=Agrobacterium tumefaciens complex TaxID=1183400 RepID=UPI000DCF8F2C|nr:plasmid partitioning protein RepB [Agrobacterium tumefaciens]MBP2536334.1 ParB family chromosome partitioning protein [Agrobacterium tumefaciens]MDP9857684.1 ParB family chromosome partitioning protein [Agrobacterium tumefaciens]TCV48627.1 ParB family protein [Agrobacterium tumefaciens]
MTSKSSRKSIVANFGLLSAELENRLSTENPAAAPQPGPSARVGAGVIGAAHRAIDDIKSERDRLKALVEAGGGAIRELDTSKIDPSPFPDRLPDDDASDFEVFRNSIRSEGQKVPIQVRKSPSSPDRYQVIYGHRRLQAARDLGIPVKAIEVEISDVELVIAQGIENADRQDLTWIERALFARRMDDANVKSRDIKAALSIDDPELARMRSVYRAVPSGIIEAIGRAAKVGRPRWADFAKTFSERPDLHDAVSKALSVSAEKRLGSDQKFLAAFNALKPKAPLKETGKVIAGPAGEQLGRLVRTAKEVRISAYTPASVEFLSFIESELPALAERFSREKSKN